MRWSDTEAIGLFENIKNGLQMTDNYGRLIHNFQNRGNSWRNLIVVGLLPKIRDGVDVVDNYGRLIWEFANRWGGQFGTSMYYLLHEVRDAVGGGGGPLELTNAEKLSLPADTPVGTVVHVTDGFLVSGAGIGSVNTFWYATGDTLNGKPVYNFVGNPSYNGSDGTDAFAYGGSSWQYNQGDYDAAAGNESFPWEADWSGSGLILTHPAVQQLAVSDPSDESHWEVVP